MLSLPLILAIAGGSVAFFILLAVACVCLRRRAQTKHRVDIEEVPDASHSFTEKYEMLEGNHSVKSTENLCPKT